MDLYTVFTDINNRGFNIDLEQVKSLMGEAKNRVLKASYQLLDMGYVSSLNFTDKTELIKSLHEEFGSDIEALYRYSDGTINISEESTIVARMITKNGEFKKVLHILYEYCYASEIIKELKDFIVLISKNGVFNPRVSLTTKDININSCKFIDRMEFLSVLKEPTPLRLLHVNSLLYFEFLESIGIPVQDVIKYKQINKGLLIKEFTYIEEVTICHYIMEFHVKANTKYKEEYFEGKRKFYNPKTKKVDKTPYFRGYLDDITIILKSITDGEIIPRLITKTVFLFEQRAPKLSEDLRYLIGQPVVANTTRTRIWENSGLYTLDWGTGEELDKCNALLGNTGEFVTEEYIRQMKNVTDEWRNQVLENIRNSEPVKIVTLSNEKGVFNREVTKMYRVEDLGIPFRVGGDIIFVYTDINSVLQNKGVEDIKSLFPIIHKELKGDTSIGKQCKMEELDYFRLVIADIIMVLITTDCGLEYTSSIPLDNRIDSIYANNYDLFYKASLIAEDYIEKTGLFK